MISFLSLFLLLSAVAPAPALPCQDPASFEKGLKSVERAMNKGQWSRASKSLKNLLEDNTRAEYVYFEKPRILQNMERIALFMEYAAPTADDVIAGKVKKYDSETGKIEVIFSGTDLSDFHKANDIYNFPVLFTGPYTIEMSGERYPVNSPISIIIGWTTEHAWRVAFGSKKYKPTIIWLQDDDQYEYLKTSEKQPLDMGQPFSLLVEVKSSRVTVKTNKKKLFSLKRPKGDYGRPAFWGLRDYELDSLKIIVKGEIEPSWIAGKIDTVMQEKLVAFEKTYAPEDELPAWLFEKFAGAGPELAVTSLRARAGGGRSSKASKETFRSYPGAQMDADGESCFDNIKGDMWSDDWDMEDLLEAIDAGEDMDGLSATAADCLRMRVLLMYGMVEEAEVPGARMMEAGADHQPSVVFYATILQRMREFERARQLLTDARTRWPKSADVARTLIETEVYAQELEAAQDLIREARSNKVLTGADAEDLQSRIDKALSGPHWPKTYSFKSKHYIIESDISEALCKEAAKLLEGAYTSYSVRLKRIKGLEKNRFRVFIFSGEASYQRYVGDSLGSTAENTGGLFSPFMKQLLIWNLPNRDDMMRTVIHEGFHQYLDLAAYDAPHWFHEGMAEYIEHGETVNGRWTMGQNRPDHLDYLQRKGVIPLEDFLFMSTSGFRRGDVSLHYSEAWAFIHFLRNSGKKEQALFDALFDGFVNSPSSGRVVIDVFADVDFDDLNIRFEDYLDELRAQ